MLKTALLSFRTQMNNTRDTRVSRKLSKELGKLNWQGCPVVIVAVPASVYLVKLCASLVPEDIPVKIVCNGLDSYERTWIAENLCQHEQVSCGKMLLHSKVIDLVVDNADKQVIFLDFDCFVFERDFFYALQESTRQKFAASIFSNPHTSPPVKIPETFCFSVNVPKLRVVMDKYGVDSSLKKYDELTEKTKTALRSIGIDDQNMPEKHKPYFDTFRLIYLLALVDGLNCEFIGNFRTISKPSDQAFHVGAGHKTSKNDNLWNMRGTYFWRKSLELCPDEALKAYYLRKYGEWSSNDVRTSAPEVAETVGVSFFDFVDDLLPKLMGKRAR